MYHPKADVDHVYLRKSNSGRYIIQLELSYKIGTCSYTRLNVASCNEAKSWSQKQLEESWRKKP